LEFYCERLILGGMKWSLISDSDDWTKAFGFCCLHSLPTPLPRLTVLLFGEVWTTYKAHHPSQTKNSKTRGIDVQIWWSNLFRLLIWRWRWCWWWCWFWCWSKCGHTLCRNDIISIERLWWLNKSLRLLLSSQSAYAATAANSAVVWGGMECLQSPSSIPNQKFQNEGYRRSDMMVKFI